MVKHLFLVCLLWTSLLKAQSPSIEAFIEQGIEGHPLSGTIIVTHTNQEAVDTTSFQLEGNALPVSLFQTVPLEDKASSLSMYQFQLESKKPGSYLLSPITVKVGKKSYQSLSSNYTVIASSQSSETLTDFEDLILRLYASIEGPQPLYPGQRAKLIYRIAYNQSLDLTHSEFPLIHVTDFKKIGDLRIREYELNGLSVQEIVQEIEIAKPGVFTYGPSAIEGYAYETNSLGQKVYFKNQLQATAPAVSIVVSDFPLANQPASFNGAIGETLAAEMKMLSPTSIKMGDNISFQLIVKGPVNLAEIRLPSLACQPGFSGFFQLDELPPSARIEGTTKVFQIEMRPISTFATSIPSIELSAFNPVTATYITWHSEAIALEVQSYPLKEQKAEAPLLTWPSKQEITTLVTQSNLRVPPLTPMTPLTFKAGGSSWTPYTSYTLFCLPCAAWLLLWLIKKRRLLPPPALKKLRSTDLLEQAMHLKINAPLLPRILMQTLELYIKENPQAYKTARRLLGDLAELQYGKFSQWDMDQLRQNVQHLVSNT
jgi:hypothetical protein